MALVCPCAVPLDGVTALDGTHWGQERFPVPDLHASDSKRVEEDGVGGASLLSAALHSPHEVWSTTRNA